MLHCCRWLALEERVCLSRRLTRQDAPQIRANIAEFLNWKLLFACYSPVLPFDGRLSLRCTFGLWEKSVSRAERSLPPRCRKSACAPMVRAKNSAPTCFARILVSQTPKESRPLGKRVKRTRPSSRAAEKRPPVGWFFHPKDLRCCKCDSPKLPAIRPTGTRAQLATLIFHSRPSS